MMTTPPFKFVVEYTTPNGLIVSRFTNEKHAKKFAVRIKKEGFKTKLFTLLNGTTKDKEVKVR